MQACGMSWATRFAVKTLVFGTGAVGMIAALSGKDLDSPQAQMMTIMRKPSVVCTVTPMPGDQCRCVVAAMADKDTGELLELIQMAEDDPRKQEMSRVVMEKCGHLATVKVQ
jgi:hypothetical protein